MTKLRWSSRDEAWTAKLTGRNFAELEIRVLTDDKSTQPTGVQLRAVALIEELAEKGLPSLYELARRYAMQHLGPDMVIDMEDDDLTINIQVAVVPRLRDSESAYIMFLGDSDIDIEHGVAVLCKDGVKFAVTHSDVAYGDHDWDETAEFDQTLRG
jgi:hypothetical protein